MVRVLQAHREHAGLDEMTTVEQFDLTYANLRECDPATDIAVVESTVAGADPEVVACSRAFWEDLDSTGRDLVVFTPILPEHVEAALFTEMVVVHRDGRRQRGPHAVLGGERRPHSVPIVFGPPRTRP